MPPQQQHSHFQAPPPIRTNTSGSQSSGAMSPASDTLSPTGTFARGSQSPAEASFFGALTSKIRGRSRSRSRNGKARERSRSPNMLPPESFPHASNTQPTSPTYTTQRPQQPRHTSTTSQSSITTIPTAPSRPSLQGPSRRSTGSSDMWRGRHSNSWLFNDFSFTETTKSFVHKGRKS